MGSDKKPWYSFLASSQNTGSPKDDEPYIVAGDYKGSHVKVSRGKVYFIPPFVIRNVHINSKTVKAHKIVSEYELESMRDNYLRGPLGTKIAVPEGILNNIREDLVLVIVSFNDGKETILEVTQEIADLIVRNCIY